MFTNDKSTISVLEIETEIIALNTIKLQLLLRNQYIIGVCLIICLFYEIKV